MRQAYHTLNAKAAFQVMGFIIPIITFFIVIVTTIIMKIYLGIFLEYSLKVNVIMMLLTSKFGPSFAG